jgi:hypothetical protein
VPVVLNDERVGRAQSLGAALEQALGRLQQAAGVVHGLGPTPALFAPLGETLMWVCALDELLTQAGCKPYKDARDAHPEGCMVQGLRYARNRSLHGDVIALGVGHGGAALGMMQLGNAGLGQAPSYRWRARATLPPMPQRFERLDQQHAYDAHLSGRPILAAVHAAFAYLRAEAGL